MSYTYGHEQAKKKPSDLFQKLVSQGHSPANARKFVSYGKKMSGKQFTAHKKMRHVLMTAKPALPKKGSYKSNYLPDLSTNKPGKYGVDY